MVFSTVTVHAWILVGSIVMLWLPRQWLRFGKRKTARRSRRGGVQDDKVILDSNRGVMRLKEQALKPRNWVDFLRALAGGIGLCCHQVGAFEITDDAHETTALVIFLIQAAILVVAVLIQSSRIQGQFTWVAPVFFLFGLSFGIIGWDAALFAIVALVVASLLVSSPGWFLGAYAFFEAVFGYFLGRLSGVSLSWLVVAVGLTLLPVALSLVTSREIVHLHKKPRLT